MSARLDRLFQPSSVAVLGGAWAANVVTQMRRAGFSGDIWPVHPRKPEIEGTQAFSSLADLPGVPDAVFLGVNRDLTIDLVAELSRMGAGGAVCFAAGFAEAGDRSREQDLVEAAGGMPVLGPNCYGILNYFDGLALWPDQHGGSSVSSGVGIISQSSNLAITLTMSSRGLPVGKVACVGNAATIDAAEIARNMLDDPRITGLGLYLEGIGDVDAFASMAAYAKRVGKPVIALKSGHTDAARTAAASHTASLAGSGVVSSAFLRQCGIAEVRDLAEMVEALKVAHVLGPLRGNRICTMSCSGGEASLIADVAGDLDLVFPALRSDQHTALAAHLGPMVALANPLDYNTFIWGDEAAMTAVFSTMIMGDVDIAALVMDMPHVQNCDSAAWAPTLRAIKAARKATGRPTALMTILPDCLPEDLAIDLADDGIVPLCGLREGLVGIEAAVSRTMIPDWRPLARIENGTTVTLDECAAKRRLAAAGLPVPRTMEVQPDLPGPFAVKGLGLAHKSDMGAVRLNVARSDVAATMAVVPGDGHLVEEMVVGARAEMLVTVRRDPVYGATLTVGIGGTTAELLADTATLILPVTRGEIAAAIAGLRLAPLLTGYRGAPGGNINAALDVAEHLADLIASDSTIHEIEVNPLILREHDAVIADALMTVTE